MRKSRLKAISALKSTINKTPEVDSLTTILNITNAKLRKLKKFGEFNTYASKRLVKQLETMESVGVDKKTKTIKIDKLSKLSPSQRRLLSKTLVNFNKAKTSTAKNIKKVREETKQKVQKELSNITDKKISKSDVDSFYSLANDSDYKYFTDYISPSEMYLLVTEGKNRNYDENQFTELLSNYVTFADENARNKAINLYNKYVRK